MKPLDEEQWAAIDAAIDKVAKEHLGSLAVISKADLIAELRPKPNFADDQVVVYQRKHLREVIYYCYGFSEEELKYCRPLNLTELGPDVKALRDAINDYLYAGRDGITHPEWDQASRDNALQKALEAFDAKHGGDS